MWARVAESERSSWHHSRQVESDAHYHQTESQEGPGPLTLPHLIENDFVPINWISPMDLSCGDLL